MFLNRFPALIVSALCLASGAALHADTINTYRYFSTIYGGGGTAGTITGSLDIDTTTGQIGYGDFYIDASVSYPNFNSGLPSLHTEIAGDFLPTRAASCVFEGACRTSESYLLSNGIELYLELSGGSLVDVTQVSTCGGTIAPCEAYGEGPVLSGLPLFGLVDLEHSDHLTLVSTTITPEPSSIALLGTGAIGAFGAFRRRVTGRSSGANS